MAIDIEAPGAEEAALKAALASLVGVTVASGKTLTANNTLTFSGTDGSSLAIGAGGTLGSAAFTAAAAYAPAGTYGDASGPVSSTDNAIARFDSTTGKLLQNSVVTITDNGGIAIAGGTITALEPLLDLVRTWNNAAVTFTSMKLNITDTASAAGSILMGLEVGGAPKFQITKSGNGYFWGNYTDASNYERLGVGWNPGSGSFDIIVAAAGTGVIRPFSFGTAGLNSLRLVTNNTVRWVVLSDGTFYPFITATYDLCTETNRARRFYTSGLRVKGVRVVTAAGAITVSATTDHVIVVNKTVGAASAVNLFATPATGAEIVVKDGKGDAGTNNITITPAAGTIDGAATFVMATNYQSVTLIYNGTEWNAI